MSKTIAELQQEYTKACVDLGNLVYQNTVMERQMENNNTDAEKLQQKMRKLSKEADDLNRHAPEATPAEVSSET